MESEEKELAMKTFVHIMQKTGYLMACIGIGGMDSKTRALPICLIIVGGLLMYGFSHIEIGEKEQQS